MPRLCLFHLRPSILLQIQHNCDPSARVFFDGTSEMQLIANRDIKEGDEITVAYVDVTQHEGESVTDARRRRRMELARGWRFACPCERCATEAAGAPSTDPEPVQKDESKVEEIVTRLDEEGASPVLNPGIKPADDNVD